MMRWTLAYCAVPFGTILVALLSGCTAGKQRKGPLEVWDDMDRQEKYKPQAQSAFFSDQRTSRRPPLHTVARGRLRQDDVMHTGMVAPDLYAGKNPLPMDAALLKNGQSQYNIYCSPCHGRAGGGQGIVALKTPAWKPSSLLDPRIAGMVDGELFSVLSNGRRSMPAYKYQIPSEKDRWAIVAYIRALQRAGAGTMDDVPEPLRAGVK